MGVLQAVGLAMIFCGGLWLGSVGAIARRAEVGRVDLLGYARVVAIVLLLVLGASISSAGAAP